MTDQVKDLLLDRLLQHSLKITSTDKVEQFVKSFLKQFEQELVKDLVDILKSEEEEEENERQKCVNKIEEIFKEHEIVFKPQTMELFQVKKSDVFALNSNLSIVSKEQVRQMSLNNRDMIFDTSIVTDINDVNY